MSKVETSPFEKAISAWILQLPGTWTPLSIFALTQTQEKALDRLILGGFVEVRVTTTLTVKGETKPLRVRWRLCGNYQKIWKDRIKEYLASHGHAGKETGILAGDYESLRLTADGELARQDFCGTVVAEHRISLSGKVEEKRVPGVDLHLFRVVSGGLDGSGGCIGDPTAEIDEEIDLSRTEAHSQMAIDPLARAMPSEFIPAVRNFLIPFPLNEFRCWKSLSVDRFGNKMGQSISGTKTALDTVTHLLNTQLTREDSRAMQAGGMPPERRIIRLSAVRSDGSEVVVFDAPENVTLSSSCETVGLKSSKCQEKNTFAEEGSKLIKILFIAANPTNTVALDSLGVPLVPKPLGLDHEYREIQNKLRGSEHRDRFELMPRLAARPDDILQALNEVRPQIVHFSGHGTKRDELIFLDDNGKDKAVSKRAIESLFKVFKDQVRIVVLNACFSKGQAVAITRHVDCAIGMKVEIGDNAAITFAASFYRALGFGHSVKDAFDQAIAAMHLAGSSEHQTPKLISRKAVDLRTMRLIS